MPTYLVERYWPGVTIERLVEAIGRGRQVMEQASCQGTYIGDISCTLIPGEEVVFSVCECMSVLKALGAYARIQTLASFS